MVVIRVNLRVLLPGRVNNDEWGRLAKFGLSLDVIFNSIM